MEELPEPVKVDGRNTRKRSRELKALGVPEEISPDKLESVSNEIRKVSSTLSDIEQRLSDQASDIDEMKIKTDDLKREISYTGNLLKRMKDEGEQEVSGTPDSQATIPDPEFVINAKLSDFRIEMTKLIEEAKKSVIATTDAKISDQNANINRVEISGTAQLSILKQNTTKHVNEIFTDLNEKIGRMEKDISVLNEKMAEAASVTNNNVNVLAEADKELMRRMADYFTKTTANMEALIQRFDTNPNQGMNRYSQAQANNGNYFLS